VYARNDDATLKRYATEHRARGGAWVCTSSLRYAGVAVVHTLTMQTAYSFDADDVAAAGD